MGEEDASPDTSPSQGSQCRESSRGSKVCGVCGDQALGYNFNAITCESCKAFFRRNALRNKEFQCPFNNACEITAVTRRFCQRCRLRKCFAIGMRKDWILSEEDKRLKREKVENNKASGRKRARSGSTTASSSSSSSQGHDKAVPSPATPAPVTPDSAVSTSEKNSVKAPVPPSLSPGPSPPTPSTTTHAKPQAWVTGMPQVKVPKLESTAEEMIPSLPRSSPVSVITSPNPTVAQVSTIQVNPAQVSTSLPSNEELSPSSFNSYTSTVYTSNTPVHHHVGVLSEEPPMMTFSSPTSLGSPQSATGSLSPNSANCLPRSNPLLNSLIINPTGEDYGSTYSKGTSAEKVKVKEIGRKGEEDDIIGANEVSNMSHIKVEGQVTSSSPSPTWWSGTSVPEGVVEDSSRSIALTPGLPDGATMDKTQKKTAVLPEVTESIDPMAKMANDTVSQLAPITLEDNWDFHTSLSRRVPIAPDSIGSILSEAIKIEFEALGPLHCSIRSSSDGGCGGSGSLQRHLNEVERAKISELVVANQALLAPLDADLSAPLDTSVCGGGEPVLLDIINLTAVAIRRLIKMSKRIGAFKSLCQEDQVALLKGGCTEMMILRSVMTYDPDKDSWKIPHSGTSRSRGSANLIKVDVLKKAPGNVYEEHQRFLRTFDARWRSDESVMLLLSAITLFTPQRPHVVHADVVRLEQVVINQSLQTLRHLASNPYVLPGSGCLEAWLAIQLQKRILSHLDELCKEHNCSSVEMLAVLKWFRNSFLAVSKKISGNSESSFRVDSIFNHCWPSLEAENCACGLLTKEICSSHEAELIDIEVETTEERLITLLSSKNLTIFNSGHNDEDDILSTMVSSFENAHVDVFSSKCNAIALAMDVCQSILNVGIVVY